MKTIVVSLTNEELGALRAYAAANGCTTLRAAVAHAVRAAAAISAGEASLKRRAEPVSVQFRAPTVAERVLARSRTHTAQVLATGEITSPLDGLRKHDAAVD